MFGKLRTSSNNENKIFARKNFFNENFLNTIKKREKLKFSTFNFVRETFPKYLMGKFFHFVVDFHGVLSMKQSKLKGIFTSNVTSTLFVLHSIQFSLT